MQINLSDKKALVCGSTQGIGKAIAEGLASAGARVICLARNEAALKSVISGLVGEGHGYLVADFQDYSSLEKLKSSIEDLNIDIVVNNAGGPPPGKVSEAVWSGFADAINMHLKASHSIMSWVTPGMKRNSYGRVINIISTSVKIPINGLGVSNTVRGAMASWSKTLANELGGDGITVNNILPGPINTVRLHNIIESQATKMNISVDESAALMKKSVPAGRFGEADEIANLAVFLASDKAAFINGVNIPVDGGRTGSM